MAGFAAAAAAICLTFLTFFADAPAQAADGIPSHAVLRQWSLDNLIAWIENHRRTAGGYEGDLFDFPGRRGFCPGWGDNLAAFFNAYSKQCSEDIVFSRYRAGKAAAAALQKCVQGSLDDPLAVLRAGPACKDSPVKPSDLAGVSQEDIDNLRQEIADLRKQVREEGVRQTAADALDVTSLWRELAKCTFKAAATYGEMTEGERGEYRDLIDAVDSLFVDVGDFISFADSLAELGPLGVLSDKLPQDQSEVGPFVQEVSGFADAAKKAVAERAGILSKARGALSGSKEADLAGEVRAVLDDIDSCHFDRAVDEAEILENKIRGRIGELRHRVVFAEKALYCKVRRTFSTLTPYARQRLLQGADVITVGKLEPRIPEFFDWAEKVNLQSDLVGEYVKLRTRTRADVMARRRAAFERLHSQARDRIVPLLQNTVKQIEYCEDRDKSGVPQSFETLLNSAQATKTYLDGHRCGEVLNAEFGKSLQAAIKHLDIAQTTRNRVNATLQKAQREVDAALGLCKVGDAFERWAEAGRSLQRVGRMRSNNPDACYREPLDALEATIRERSSLLSDLARRVDAGIARARVSRTVCETQAARDETAATRTLLNTAQCPKAEGVRWRRRQLDWIDTAKNEECDRATTLPKAAYAVVTVSGAGYIPHWAGGSWVVKGKDDVLLTLARDESLAERIADLRKTLEGDICKADSPSIWGIHRPWVWTGGPDVGIKVKPTDDRKAITRDSLEDTWESMRNDGPPLGQLKKDAGCG
jgi:hypothetical protein